MKRDRPLIGESEDYYRKFDNDSLYLALRSGLRGLAVLFILCFLLWPLGYYRSRNWKMTTLERITVDYTSGWTEMYLGYRVDGEILRFHRRYFGGSPPRILGGVLEGNRSEGVYYDPNDPSEHVRYRSPSWMTILLPFLSALSLWSASRLTRHISPGAEKDYHPYKD